MHPLRKDCKLIKRVTQVKDDSRLFARRSIVALKNIDAGSYITEELITCKRPNHGISPMCWDDIIGKKTTQNIDEDKPLQWDDFE